MDKLANKNTKQVQVLTGRIVHRDAIRGRDSAVSEGDIVIEAVRNV